MPRSNIEAGERKSRTVKQVLGRFAGGALRAVIMQIPVTLIAVIIGAVTGGFLGLAMIPLAPFFALGGAVSLGLPVAVWEHVLLRNDESAWDYIL